jgi:hypothetical protein
VKNNFDSGHVTDERESALLGLSEAVRASCNHITGNLQFRPPAFASWTRPTRDTTNLPPDQAFRKIAESRRLTPEKGGDFP